MSETIGQRIKQLREQHTMNQDQLADRLSVSKQTISNWETDTKVPRMGAIESLSSLFNVTKSYLIDGGDKPKQQLSDSQIMIAAHIDDDTSPEEVKQILDYIDYIKSKHQDD